MNALDILYTPLDTPTVPKTDVTKLLSWVESYHESQAHPNRLDSSKIEEVSTTYPWNIIYPRINHDWCYDFNTEFPELADFFSSAYRCNEPLVSGIFICNIVFALFCSAIVGFSLLYWGNGCFTYVVLLVRSTQYLL